MLAVQETALDVILHSWTTEGSDNVVANWEAGLEMHVQHVVLRPGDLFIWRGDLYHRGVASTDMCLRILFHTYSPAMDMVDDTLYGLFQFNQ